MSDVLFLSSYHNKIDRKGRVSIPANFRDVLTKISSQSIIVYKSLTKDALEGSTIDHITNINNAISNFDPFSQEKDAFSTAIFADSISLDIDQEGRTTIPKNYLQYAHITDNVIFVGKGNIFEIWNPDNFEKYLKECREFAIKNAKLIKW